MTHNGEHIGTGGISEVNGNYAVLPKPKSTSVSWTDTAKVRNQIHEFSHLLNCNHNGTGDWICTTGQRCIMNSGFDNITYLQLRDLWCDACKVRIKNCLESKY